VISLIATSLGGGFCTTEGAGQGEVGDFTCRVKIEMAYPCRDNLELSTTKPRHSHTVFLHANGA